MADSFTESLLALLLNCTTEMNKITETFFDMTWCSFGSDGRVLGNSVPSLLFVLFM